MQPDRARWNDKYASPVKAVGRANPRLAEAIGTLTPGVACDVAMGVGHNIKYLCQSGWTVVGVEISDLALIHAQRQLEGVERAYLIQADAARLGVKAGAFDLVVCTYFLDRSVFPWIRTLLKPRGRVFFETYDINHLRYIPDFPEEYCIKDGEPQKFFPGFKIQQQKIENGSSSVRSVVATRV